MRSIDTIVDLTPERAEAAIRSALGDQGFGVLTEIDVAAVFHAKLGVDRPFLKILGACNPGFAQRALELDPTVSLLLPCNVVVESVAGGTRISAVDPLELMADPRFDVLGREVSTHLRSAVDAVTAGARQSS